ncbi:hypothetical protein [Sphingomonas sp. CROZ-RG-20F-R02-07]|uniref:hypothetical protein n=1 Tax=Sphingomonas sp. CROZ-RG-20F-R02-07 TaxID=2914832 RepID=UPI001F57A2CC|nr:hypothetical protein [Sphingomonas sp. CROZ-RG-20F-R02-07]
MIGIPRHACHHLRDYCAAATVHLLREREARYPALVNAGKVTAEDAATRLELALAIVAQWRWVVDPAAPVLPAFGERGYFGAHGFEMRDELATAARRQRAVADRNPDNADAAELADLYEAVAWWQQGHPGDARIITDVCAERAATWRQRDASSPRMAA